MTNLYTASRQWSSRPDDERFLSLADLKQFVSTRRRESWTSVNTLSGLRVIPQADGDLSIEAQDRTRGQTVILQPSNWSFGQLCQSAEVPASYVKKLPAELAAINLQWGLEHGQREDGLLLAHENGEHRLTAITSTSYGRIWDEQVVDAVIRVNADGRWKVPAASYATQQPKRATTLYASDRDVFLFLVDESHPIEHGEDRLFRGFTAWNSEVGNSTFGLTTFLYRYVCDNRIIWGATDVQELRIRHTGGAPDRFAYEGAKYLDRYANESPALLEGQIQKAKEFEPAKDAAGIQSWLKERGFTTPVIKSAVAKAEEEEGSARSLWNIIQGVTAHARSINTTDDRIALERKAGELMRYAV